MPRRPRNVLPERGVYHVTARGVARSPIYLDAGDRQFFVTLLRSVARQWTWTCHAYCLMQNHYHLVVETYLDRLSKGEHRLNGIHAQRFNARHDRVGHLFQDRFHAQVIRDEEHLVNACEYVWNNPVAVGLCRNADDWPWSGRC
jgi:REP element-mobilizing transposase RayT